jgi:hypothetical protein
MASLAIKTASKAIRDFPWWDYGMDDVSYALRKDPDAQEWVGDLARAVVEAVRKAEDPG